MVTANIALLKTKTAKVIDKDILTKVKTLQRLLTILVPPGTTKNKRMTKIKFMHVKHAPCMLLGSRYAQILVRRMARTRTLVSHVISCVEFISLKWKLYIKVLVKWKFVLPMFLTWWFEYILREFWRKMAFQILLISCCYASMPEC